MPSGRLFEKEFWVEERAKHREKVLQRLEKFLEERDKASLVALVDVLWASEAVQDREKAVERRIIQRGFTPEYVAKKLELVKSDPLKLLEERVPGFGPASITEILFCVDPERFTVFNKRSKVLVKSLGYGDFDHEPFSLETYEKFLEAEMEIYKDFKVVKDAIERELGISIPKFDFVDGMATLFYEDQLTVDMLKELRRQVIVDRNLDAEVFNRALESIRAAMDQYFFWLERGDSEERAMEKAVSYASGMLASSGLLSDPQKKHSFMIALEAMAKLSEGMVDLLRELS